MLAPQNMARISNRDQRDTLKVFHAHSKYLPLITKCLYGRRAVAKGYHGCSCLINSFLSICNEMKGFPNNFWINYHRLKIQGYSSMNEIHLVSVLQCILM